MREHLTTMPFSNLTTPSAPLLAHYRGQLRRWHPFADMEDADVDWFLARCEQRYLEADEVLLAPDRGIPDTLFLIREGQVRSQQGLGGQAGAGFVHDAGDMLPVAALLAKRAVMSTYVAAGDLFVLAIKAADVETLAGHSPAFADFLNRRVQSLLEKSRQSMREVYASRVLSEQSLETPLEKLIRYEPVHCGPDLPLRAVLQTMHERKVGSMLVLGDDGALQGILTRNDLPGLVIRPDFSLDAPIASVMSSPVRSLTHRHTAQDAAMLMSQFVIRHVPVTRDGKLLGMVSERDLFALQRATLQQVSARIHGAGNVAALRVAADDIRHLASSLLVQGVQARQVTTLISHLNDLLTGRLVEIRAKEAGIDTRRLCWVVMGSEGRGEQTIATDQDNAMIVPDDTEDDALEAIRRWADQINQDLDACGYPLCKGGIMAGQAACCLRQRDWLARFERWISQGSPQDLLHASIFFDFRAIAGDLALTDPLTALIKERIRETPRFLHQLAVNALTHRSPLNWLGNIELDDREGLDLKLQGTALFVDAARIFALAQGVTATGTRDRLEQSGLAMGLKPNEYESWIGAFEFLQSLRLRVQLDGETAKSDEPNRLAFRSLSNIDRRILASSFRVARSIQQRLELDFAR